MHCLDTRAVTYHSPPEGICIAGEVLLAILAHGVFLCQIHEVGREDEAQEPYVQRRDQLLKHTNRDVSIN